MFETGMSALVLKICSEYAKAFGLNFPPCVQQEINAIAQYVDLHTVKDLKVEQNGSVVTITCYTEGEQEKVFTVTLPEVNVDVLFNLIKGSSSVDVDKSEDGTNLVVRLEQSVINDINSRLTKPANPTSESAVTMFADGTVGTKPLSEIGGGGKIYTHNIRLNAQFTYNDNASGDFLFSFTSSRQTEYKLQDLTTLFNAFGSNIITTATIRKQETGSMPNNGIANVLYSEGADVLEIRAFITDGNTVTGYYKTGSLSNVTSLQDTVTEV